MTYGHDTGNVDIGDMSRCFRFR